MVSLFLSNSHSYLVGFESHDLILHPICIGGESLFELECIGKTWYLFYKNNLFEIFNFLFLEEYLQNIHLNKDVVMQRKIGENFCMDAIIFSMVIRISFFQSTAYPIHFSLYPLYHWLHFLFGSISFPSISLPYFSQLEVLLLYFSHLLIIPNYTHYKF